MLQNACKIRLPSPLQIAKAAFKERAFVVISTVQQRYFDTAENEW
jgi:hypothetical protein